MSLFSCRRLTSFLTTCLLLSALGGFSAEMEVLKDVSYGKDPMQKLDIYKPRTADSKRPAVLWIHGGGWREGDKFAMPNGIGTLGQLLVDNGYVAFSCNYRLLPDHKHPAQVDDVQRAVRWIRANASQYGVDPKKVGAIGISAGGHLAAYLAVKESHHKQDDSLDRYKSQVEAAVCLNGPTDFRPLPELDSPVLRQALTGWVDAKSPEEEKKLITEAAPITHVNKKSSPLLFIAGDKDTWILPYHATLMADELKKHKVPTGVVILEGAGHGIFPTITPRVNEEALRWFGSKLKGPGKSK